MKKILVPTDFSPNAQNAFVYALELAKEFEAEVILLNTYSIPYSGSTVMVDITDVLKEEAWKELEKQMETARLQYPSVHVTPAAEYGSAADVITAAVDNFGIDFIIMGTKGAHGIKGTIFGSITSAVMKKVDIPVLAVPEDFEYKKPKSVLYPTDLSGGYGDHFKALKSILEKFQSELTILNVSEDAAELNQEKIKADFTKEHQELLTGTHEFVFVQDDEVEEGIVTHIVNNPCDLMVTVAHHYGIFERLMHRSMVRRLTLHSTVPLLIVRD